MSWETWALVALTVLCATVAVWGFLGGDRASNARFLRLAYLDGSRYLEVPASGGAGRWHRGQHRAA